VRLREQYRHPDRAARAWKANGGKVVGYLCDNVPDELIDAAGFLPVRVSGAPATSLDPVRRYVDGLFQPTRRIGFAESMLSRLLDGTYEYLDYLIVPHNRHAIQAIYQELLRARGAFPELKLPELYPLDRSWLPFYASEVFNRDRLLDLHRTLETWSGRQIADDALAEAIEKSNEHRPKHKRNRGQKEQGVHYYEEQSTGVHDQRFFEQSRFNSAVRKLVKGCHES